VALGSARGAGGFSKKPPVRWGILPQAGRNLGQQCSKAGGFLKTGHMTHSFLRVSAHLDGHGVGTKARSRFLEI
jgi:hypothetical protein